MRPSPPNAAALCEALAPCPSPVGKLMNTKMKSDNNRQTNSYGMPPAQNKALEPAGSADA